MNLTSIVLAAAIGIAAASATAQVSERHARHEQMMPRHASGILRGPHGGALHQISGVQIETVVELGGLRLFVYDRAGQSMRAAQGRGVATLRTPDSPKQYRYDLLPDNRGTLTAPINLSKIAGRQIEMHFQLVGLAAAESNPVAFSEVATVPVGPQQLAAAAIARQEICPVSGKPLGSMGEPVAVGVEGQTLYVCCAGCVDAINADPAKYATGRPEITVSESTAVDAPMIAKQGKCPVMDQSLGNMGKPVKVVVGERPIFLCCKGCVKKVQAEPGKYLTMVHGHQNEAQPQVAARAGDEQGRPEALKATAADAPFVAAQKRCPVMDEPLDAMGGPYRVNADGRAIYICCPGCAKKIAAEPQKYLALLAQQGVNAPILH